MAECTHDCSSCKEACASKDPKSMLEPQNRFSDIKKVIGVVSGKGGVGKSLVTSLLAASAQKRGMNTAILDADITGPSIPRAFGVHTMCEGTADGILPTVTECGVSIMSANLMLEKESMPVIWRGPMIAGIVKQFWGEVLWGDVDCMFIDMPPGTGDVPLTVFQSIPLDGIIIVTSPQELVGMIVAKAVNMAKTMNIPVLGLIENFSYFKCPDCGKEHRIYGESGIDKIAKEFDLDVLAHLPIDPTLAALTDAGKIHEYDGAILDGALDKITALPRRG